MNANVSSQNSIHIRLGYEEAMAVERSILHSEMSSLRITQEIQRYSEIRAAELLLKSRIYLKLKEIRLTIKRLQDMLPAPKVPSLLKKSHILGEEHEKAVRAQAQNQKKPGTQQTGQEDINSQLRQIERRLGQLQRNA